MATADPGPGPTQTTQAKPACAVTFGCSTLLGRHLAAALASSGRWSTVAVLDPSPPAAEQPAAPLAHFAVDLSDPAAALAPVLAGVVAVFHVDPTSSAATACSDGSSFLYLHSLAAEGTRRLLAACRASGVRRVVYTGSTDVVTDGALDVISADEDSVSYPEQFGNGVSELRAQVEMMVLSVDGNGGMRTCVLCPSNLFGPGDSSVTRFIAGYARSPLCKFITGSGGNMSDFTYVENVSHANICAEQALCSNAASVAGKPFFITNDEPIKTWEFMSCMLEAMGCQRPRINLPSKMLLFAAWFSNMIHHGLCLQMSYAPLLYPDTLYFLAHTRTFNTSKARRLLGYNPIVSLKDGIMRTAGSILELPDNLDLSRKQGSCVSSKADKLLGGGIAADILLWRDEKKTFSYVTLLFLLFYWFLLSDRTFVSSSAKILLVISLALYIHGVLPSQVYGLTVEKVTPDYFEVSHSALRNPIIRLASLWNGGIHKLRVIAEGDDWSTFLKVVASLFCIKVMLNFQFRMLMGVVLASLFIVFIVYEQCEEEIDASVTIASAKMRSLMDRVVRNLPAVRNAMVSFKALYILERTLAMTL
ncbi:3beta-hydroxysteroid-dehydrogenase/decarboxylase isoform X1 [Brachypodium distachyon]|nr:3beta-hydroxysteroid-dehydrogenase/decarboxylase isoform X1 [Brachypodium distachyon]|eukprot:XP_003578442.1 3beta-hydroxysteroid-dehydrogenase/decarboxylase isoform X1 [Brachypodium distachyon]